jgi:transcriptional regulator with XRE-family HTH domain
LVLRATNLGGTVAPRPQHLGGRIRQLRYDRGWSQKQLGDLAGVSESAISRVESGDRGLSKDAARAVATAFGITPSELTGQPIEWIDPDLLDARETIPAVRLALVGSQLGRAGQEPRPVDAIATDVDRIVRHRSAVQLAEMGRALPGPIAELYSLTSTARGEERATALRHLVRALNSAMTLAHAFGYPDLAYMIAERSMHAAAELDSEWLAIAEFSAVHAMLPMGGQDQAYALATGAADRARAATAGPGLAAYGALLLVSGLMASITGHTAEADERLAEAAQVADRTGEAGPDVAFFGPTNTALYRMGAALERDDPEQAVAYAANVNPDLIASVERRAVHLMTYGRALAQLRGREHDAVAAFGESERMAPLRFRAHTVTRDVLPGLQSRVRPDTAAGKQLRGLVYRAGINRT